MDYSPFDCANDRIAALERDLKRLKDELRCTRMSACTAGGSKPGTRLRLLAWPVSGFLRPRRLRRRPPEVSQKTSTAMKVGDLEVTALFDGATVLDLHWLTAKKVAMDRVERDLHEDPHLLDVGDTGFLVNTGKHLILVDAGAGT